MRHQGGNLAAVPPKQRTTPAHLCPTCGKGVEEHIPPGALVEYYGDLSSGVLPPEDMRLDTIQYRVRIDPTGQITFESDFVQLISRYNFALRRLVAFALNPGVAGAAPALLNFNIEEDGRNFTVFKNDASFSSVFATPGAVGTMEWDGVYITVPGTQLRVTWTVDTRWAALVGATREFGIQLIGDLVICRPVK